MSRFTTVSTLFVSLAFLSGCNAVDQVKAFAGRGEQKPLTMVTPKGYAKPVPIQSAAPMSWEKKALLAMIAPSIAEQIEKQHDGLKAPANQKGQVASTGSLNVPMPSAVKTAPNGSLKIAKVSRAHKARQVVASNKHKKASAKVAAAPRRSGHAVFAAKF